MKAVVVSKTWYGRSINRKAQRAAQLGTIALGDKVASIAKDIAHVLTGTMARSIHTAEPNYFGDGDEATARAGTDLQESNPATVYSLDPNPTGVSIVVGSWVSYAIVEEEGRGHEFIQPAVDEATRYADGIMVTAWQSEGL